MRVNTRSVSAVASTRRCLPHPSRPLPYDDSLTPLDSPARCAAHYTTLYSTPLYYTPLHSTRLDSTHTSTPHLPATHSVSHSLLHSASLLTHSIQFNSTRIPLSRSLLIIIFVVFLSYDREDAAVCMARSFPTYRVQSRNCSSCCFISFPPSPSFTLSDSLRLHSSAIIQHTDAHRYSVRELLRSLIRPTSLHTIGSRRQKKRITQMGKRNNSTRLIDLSSSRKLEQEEIAFKLN